MPPSVRALLVVVGLVSVADGCKSSPLASALDATAPDAEVSGDAGPDTLTAAACRGPAATVPDLDRLGARHATFVRVDALLTFQPDTDPSRALYADLPALAPSRKRTDRLDAGGGSILALVNYDSAADPTKNPPKIGSVAPDERAVFEGWNYVDIYGAIPSFGNMAATGSIMVPTPQEILVAHRNGVRVLGSIFFGEHELAAERAFATLPTADAAAALERIAKAYGFEGWFLNPEAGGLTPAEVDALLELTEAVKARGLDIVFYDSLDDDGQITYANALTAENRPFLDASTAFFTNYWWRPEALASSAAAAGDRSASVFMGVGWWAGCCGNPGLEPLEGRDALRAIQRFNTTSSRKISAGLWAATYPMRGTSTPSQPAEQIHKQLLPYWYTISPNVNAAEPRVADLVTPRTAITRLPFASSFDLGRGDARFAEGTRVAGSRPWGNLAEQDPVPHALGTSSAIDVDYDFWAACRGGSSLRLAARLDAAVPIYLTAIPMPAELHVEVSYQLSGADEAELTVVVGDRRERVRLPASTSWRAVSVRLRRGREGEEITEIGAALPALAELRLGEVSLR